MADWIQALKNLHDQGAKSETGHASLMEPKELIALAASLARPFSPSAECSSGTVAAALVTAESSVFTGVCLDTRCSLGFCAEHAAVVEMLKAHQSNVRIIAAVNKDGAVLPPCGRCRELLWQVDGSQ
jgi:cytidine deaminase